MNDDKRRLRELKRRIKKTGNRKRRRFLKDVGTEPEDFDFGLDRSRLMNELGRTHCDESREPFAD